MTHANRLAFVDPDSPVAYDQDMLEIGPLGPAEANVLSVAQGLEQLMRVTIWQRERQPEKRAHGITFRRFSERPKTDIEADYIVVIGNVDVLWALRDQNPDAGLFLWLHSFSEKLSSDFAQLCMDTSTTIITLSRYHRDSLRQILCRENPRLGPRVPIEFIYPPVSIPFVKKAPYLDEDRLVYFAGQDEALGSVLEHFQYCRRAYPSLRLSVFDPSCFLDQRKQRSISAQQGVESMGPMPRWEALKHLSSAFCLFAPVSGVGGDSFPLAFAEANALSVPVLTSNTGAAEEVVQGCRSQLLDDVSPQNVLRTLTEWKRHGRPEVGLKSCFHIEIVAAEWFRVLLSSGKLSQQKGRDQLRDVI